VLAANPPPELAAPATYLMAFVEFDARHFAPAAALWKEVVEKYKTHALAADAAFRMGVALKEAGENDQAATALQAFAAAHPDSTDAPKARQLAAACLSAGGKTEEAGAVLASLARDPKANDTVLYDLAWAQRAGKNQSAAMESYRRLLKDHPKSKLVPAVRTELAELLYEDKKYDQAVELLEAVVADASADPKLLSSANYRLGWCYQKLNKADKAAAAFSKFDPTRGGASEDVAASALLQAGLAYAEEGKFDDAEKSLAAMIKSHPKNTQLSSALLRLGEVQAEQGKYDASAQTYATFLQKYPKDTFAPRAHFGIGWSLENRKQYEAARAEYKKVIAASNGETAARAQFQIGETYLGEGKFDSALPALLAVEDVYAYPLWSARALYESGRVFEELKQPDQAKKQYQQVTTKYKAAPEAKLAQERLQALSK
jgi:TolA-binding protein